MPIGLQPMPVRATAQASVCVEGGCNLPQGVVAPCGADQRDAKGQDRRRVAGGRQVLRALRHLTCSDSLGVKGAACLASASLYCQQTLLLPCHREFMLS